MPERIAVFTDQIPNAFGHYSQAIKLDNSLFISALFPVDTKTGKLVSPDATEQYTQVFNHLATLVQFAGAQLSNILMLRVYMTHFEDLKILEAISKERFFFVPPARTIVPVPWMLYGARVSLDAYVEINPAQKVAGGMLF